MTRVADVMTRGVVVLRDDTTLREALTWLATQHISGAPVVDGHRRLIGAVTASDILQAEAEAPTDDTGGRYLDRTTVRDVMTTPALTIEVDADLREAALAMEYAEIHRLFVLEEGELVGVVSQSDVSRALAMGRV